MIEQDTVKCSKTARESIDVPKISRARHYERHYARAMREALAATLTHVLPSHIADDVALELGFSLRRALYSRKMQLRLSRLDGCRVNIGCGDRPTPGWVNIELKATPQTYFWDCRRGLPFSDNRVAAVYCEHVFEHFHPETEARLFVRGCLRCLRSGGVLRIVVPDAGAYLHAYTHSWERLAALSPLEQTHEGWREKRINYKGLTNVYSTKMQLINEVFRQGGQHKYAYDEQTLLLVLREAGFSNVIRQSFGVSLDKDMAPDSETRKTESLYAEAVK
jgi:predicted SAM-dependent methyltransferase